MINKLKTHFDSLTLYYAGLPSFTRNFSRDTLISGLILSDKNMLRDQLIFCSLKQGLKKDSYTGEEKGKIHHEYPGVELDGLSTEYNACDTSALFLIAFKKYLDMTNDFKFLKNYKKNAELAVGYILSHLKYNVFIETPDLCGAKKFALACTYWKDSQLTGRENNQAEYPIVYPLVHIQNMCGLRAAAQLLNEKNLYKISKKMKEKLNDLFNKKTGMFYMATDKKGKISAINSDSLHALFYLEKNDLSKEQIQKISESAKILETVAGYRALDKNFNFKIEYDGYDFQNNVWPFEQALIHIGAKKFNLKRVVNISYRVHKCLNSKSAPETLLLNNKKVTGVGCDPQLWTIAAKEYFKSL